MFDTWEPFLSATIGLLDTESLAKICEIHAAVEKVYLHVRRVLITAEIYICVLIVIKHFII